MVVPKGHLETKWESNSAVSRKTDERVTCHGSLSWILTQIGWTEKQRLVHQEAAWEVGRVGGRSSRGGLGSNRASTVGLNLLCQYTAQKISTQTGY